MAIGLGTALITGGTALAGLAGGITGNIIQGEYQKDLQEDQQTFIDEQAQKQIIYNAQQMAKLGYSPSMLFDKGTPTGGGGGSGGQGSAPKFAEGILEGINVAGKIISDNNRNKLLEREIDLKEKYYENKQYDTIMSNKISQENLDFKKEKYYDSIIRNKNK